MYYTKKWIMNLASQLQCEFMKQTSDTKGIGNYERKDSLVCHLYNKNESYELEK